MPKEEKVKSAASADAKAAKPKKAKASKGKKAKAAKAAAPPKTAATAKTKKTKKPKKPAKTKKTAKANKTGKRNKAGNPPKGAKKGFTAEVVEKAKLVSSVTVYQGPLFRVQHDKLIEPGGHANERDVIRHNGSVVILAMDTSKSKKNPWIVIERQYRHAANQFLWELPAGKLDPGEEALAGAKRELAEETGYSAKKWKPLVDLLRQPGVSGRVDDGLSGRGAGGGRSTSGGGRENRVPAGEALRSAEDD